MHDKLVLLFISTVRWSGSGVLCVVEVPIALDHTRRCPVWSRGKIHPTLLFLVLVIVYYFFYRTTLIYQDEDSAISLHRCSHLFAPSFFLLLVEGYLSWFWPFLRSFIIILQYEKLPPWTCVHNKTLSVQTSFTGISHLSDATLTMSCRLYVRPERNYFTDSQENSWKVLPSIAIKIEATLKSCMLKVISYKFTSW